MWQYLTLRTLLQVGEEVKLLLEAKAQAQKAEQRLKAASGLPKDESGNPDYSEDFFGRSAFLAVSGQLNAEAYACSLTDVYTFGKPSVPHRCLRLCFETLWGIDVGLLESTGSSERYDTAMYRLSGRHESIYFVKIPFWEYQHDLEVCKNYTIPTPSIKSHGALINLHQILCAELVFMIWETWAICRPYIQSRAVKHLAAPGRVLDDRARNGLRRLEAGHSSSRGILKTLSAVHTGKWWGRFGVFPETVQPRIEGQATGEQYQDPSKSLHTRSLKKDCLYTLAALNAVSLT